MSLFHFYLRNRKVIIPTVALTEAGFYMDVGPVTVVDTAAVDKLKAVLMDALEGENPGIPTPEKAAKPGSVVLDAVGIKRWEAFERQSILYTVHITTKSVWLYVTGRGANGMWVKASENERAFPLSTPVPDLVTALIDDMTKQPEMTRAEPALPMLLPARDTDVSEQQGGA